MGSHNCKFANSSFPYSFAQNTSVEHLWTVPYHTTAVTDKPMKYKIVNLKTILTLQTSKIKQNILSADLQSLFATPKYNAKVKSV